MIFLRNGEAVSERVSYGDLIERVDRLASGLARAGLSGEPVAIMLPAGVSFVGLILACLAARVIAIPLPYSIASRNLDRLAAILADARPAAIVSDEVAIKGALSLGVLGNARGGCRLFSEADLDRCGSLDFGEPDADTLALVQYSSGSTRQPTGIAITHGNLVANELMLQSAFGHYDGWVSVNWLPHFHDMGLIGAILQPLFAGGTAVLMPPLSFVQKPVRWLKAIERFGARCAGGPCFGYDLCVRRVTEAEARELDLSSWKLAACGSEPVRASVLDRFARHFAAAGFDASAFVPCYGLAEATLIVSSAEPGEGFSRAEIGAGERPRTFVSCGRPVPDCRILIRGSTQEAVEEGSLGEICVAGPHVAPGAWNGENRVVEEFPTAFRDASGTRFLPTGDVGVLRDGKLYPIDRLKDTIIVHGAQIHAIDIESTVLETETRGLVAAVAFSVDRPSKEELVVLCEVDKLLLGAEDATLLAARIPRLVGDRHGILPKVGLLARGALPRTTSGKVQRQLSKARFLAGDLKSVITEHGIN